MNLMDMEHISITMEMYIKVSGKMVRRVVKEYLLGIQAISMKGIGLMGNVQEMELWQ